MRETTRERHGCHMNSGHLRRISLALTMSQLGLASRVTPVHTALRNSTRDEGGPFGFDDQDSIPSHRKLLWSIAMVVSVAERAGHDPVRRD